MQTASQLRCWERIPGFDQARGCFEAAARLDEDYPLGHYFAGLCLMKKGVYREAITRTLNLHPR